MLTSLALDKNEDYLKTEDNSKIEDNPRNAYNLKIKMPPKKIKMALKMKTLTAPTHATFQLVYRNKTDLGPIIMFSIETGNRNQQM